MKTKIQLIKQVLDFCTELYELNPDPAACKEMDDMIQKAYEVAFGSNASEADAEEALKALQVIISIIKLQDSLYAN